MSLEGDTLPFKERFEIFSVVVEIVQYWSDNALTFKLPNFSYRVFL
ncbi:MAG: hypothetical protein WDO14_02470 [Bacteroidota bacterium]